jgi:hypothetical protein
LIKVRAQRAYLVLSTYLTIIDSYFSICNRGIMLANLGDYSNLYLDLT